jgi:YcxB-like protein
MDVSLALTLCRIGKPIAECVAGVELYDSRVQASIELHGQLTRTDLLKFNYVHFLHRHWPLLVVWLILLASVGYCLRFPKEVRLSTGYLRLMLQLLVAWIVWIAIKPVWQAWREYARHAYLREPITQIYTAAGIRSRSPSISSDVSWEIFTEVLETRSLFVLYYASGIALLVPKRFLTSNSQLDAWRDLVCESLKLKRVTRPALIGKWF